MIKTCTCKHEGQDKIHGKQQRVHNEVKSTTTQRQCRCTVCGVVK